MGLVSSWLRRCVAVRSSRRPMYLLLLWMCMCYAVFHFAARDVTIPYAARSINTRLLLEKVVDSWTPRLLTERAADNSTTERALNNHVEPLVDKTPSLSEEKMLEQLQSKIPNLPSAYWKKPKFRPTHKNATCAKYPSVYELDFDNVYWQVAHTSNGTFYLYGAYYDVRPLNRLSPTVRILGMANRIVPKVTTYCQFWYDGVKEPEFNKVLEYKYIWNKKWGNYKQGVLQPYLLACQTPRSVKGRVPASVSVVEKPCDHATNNLRVVYDRPAKKKDFAVCIKGLDFLHQDLSVRLVEWIELLNLLGADKIFMYDLEVHPNITKVLQYYSKQGKVHVTPLTLPGGQPNLPGLQHLYLKSKVNNKRQNELIPYNDCLYRNLYTYRYIALLDTDEIIMPVRKTTWLELMEDVVRQALSVKNESRASYNVRNVYFLDDLLHEHGWFRDAPRYMHMLQHVYRSRNFTKPGQYVKSFHNPERVLTLHNHFPLECLGGVCKSYSINTTDAQLQHYREDCVKTLKNSCKSEYRKYSKMDTTIWRYKKELVARTTETLFALGFLPRDAFSSTGKKR